MAELERPLDRHAFQRAAHMIPQAAVEGKGLLSGDDLQLLFESGTEVSSQFARHLRQRRDDADCGVEVTLR